MNSKTIKHSRRVKKRILSKLPNYKWKHYHLLMKNLRSSEKKKRTWRTPRKAAKQDWSKNVDENKTRSDFLLIHVRQFFPHWITDEFLRVKFVIVFNLRLRFRDALVKKINWTSSLYGFLKMYVNVFNYLLKLT